MENNKPCTSRNQQKTNLGATVSAIKQAKMGSSHKFWLYTLEPYFHLEIVLIDAKK